MGLPLGLATRPVPKLLVVIVRNAIILRVVGVLTTCFVSNAVKMATKHSGPCIDSCHEVCVCVCVCVQGREIPSVVELKLSRLDFDDFSLDSDDMLLAAIRIFHDTHLVHSFNIQHDVHSLHSTSSLYSLYTRT